MIYVNEALCKGCGVCAEVCTTGAIQIINGLARIAQDVCRECDACLSACPHGALLAIDEPVRAKHSIVTREPAPLKPRLARPGWLPALGAALAFVGQEIIPRAAGALLDAWDQRQSLSSSAGYRPRGGGQRRRWRGGQ